MRKLFPNCSHIHNKFKLVIVSAKILVLFRFRLMERCDFKCLTTDFCFSPSRHRSAVSLGGGHCPGVIKTEGCANPVGFAYRLHPRLCSGHRSAVSFKIQKSKFKIPFLLGLACPQNILRTRSTAAMKVSISALVL